MSRVKAVAAEVGRTLLALAVFGGLALVGLEIWESRYAWPVDPAWYRLEEEGGEVRLGCQDYAPVAFSAQPAAGVTRVLVLGGSTTFGFPDHPEGDEPIHGMQAGFVGAMQAALDAAVDPVELVDLGVNGGSSIDTLRIARRAMGWGAAGLVVYDGHNEFLAPPGRFSPTLWRFALYRRFAVLLAPPPRRAPGPVGPPAFSPAREQAVLDLFSANLDALLSLAEDHDLPVVLATQASNLRGFDPNWSRTGDVSAEQLWRDGRARGDAADLRAAADADGLPFRATSAINAVIADRAKAHGVVLVDAEVAIQAGGPVPGNALFYDWLHPRPEAARRLATAMLDGMVDAGIIDEAPPVPEDAALPDDPASSELRAARSWLQWAFVRAWDPRWRLEQARAHAKAALLVHPDDVVAQGIVSVCDAVAAGRPVPSLDAEARAALAPLHPDLAELLAASAE